MPLDRRDFPLIDFLPPGRVTQDSPRFGDLPLNRPKLLLGMGECLRLGLIFRQAFCDLQLPFADRQRGLGSLLSMTGGIAFRQNRLDLLVRRLDLGRGVGDNLLGRVYLVARLFDRNALGSDGLRQCLDLGPELRRFRLELVDNEFQLGVRGDGAQGLLGQRRGP